MIVSSISGNDVQTKSPQFKGVYQVKGKYSPRQEVIMSEIRQKLGEKNEDGRTHLEALGAKGYDVFMSDSILRENAIDVLLTKTKRITKESETEVSFFDGKTLSVDTYAKPNSFNVKDTYAALEESRQLDKYLITTFTILGLALLSILGIKSCTNKTIKNILFKSENIQNEVKSGVMAGKNLFRLG